MPDTATFTSANITLTAETADTVTIDLSTGLLGHLTSSRRYKEDIKPMDKASEALYRLKPVTYRYKKEIDRTQSLAFGLIAEEVAEVNPDLVAHNAQGQPESVHYEMVNAMLLNEFLKEHKKVEAAASNRCGVEVNGRSATERNGSPDSAVQRAGRANPESERPARSEQAGVESSREQTVKLKFKAASDADRHVDALSILEHELPRAADRLGLALTTAFIVVCTTAN